MDANRDEAERCIQIAQKALNKGNLDEAKKFLLMAEKLYPSQRARDLLNKIKSTPTSNGNADSPPGQKDGVPWRPPQSPKRDAKAHEPEYTAEQMEAVKRIKKCKDYYEVLGVTKEVTDSEIRKAYKKLALQLHPDKNHAPGASEAFKAIANAFAILTDPEKRKSYDLHGNDEAVSYNHMGGRRHFTNEYAYTRGFESDVTAEELFNMFFGGGLTQQNFNMRQRRFHRAEHQHQREPQQQGYTALINLLPIILLIGVSMTSSFFISDPIYSLQPTQKYHVQRRTNSLKIPYYVKDNFHIEYQGSVVRLEASVEEEYINYLRHSCSRERSYKETTLAKAKTFGDRELYKKATNMLTPSCENLQKLLNS